MWPRGSIYPTFLLESWDEYALSNSVENDRPGTYMSFGRNYIVTFTLPPDIFPEHQLYGVLATENAGTTVEQYEVSKNS